MTLGSPPTVGQRLGIAAQPLVLAVAGILAVLRMPAQAQLYPDPSYPYLLNGLAITVGSGPQHTDHPGTSLQALIGAVEMALHTLTSPGVPLVADVVQRPETYLTVLSVLLVLAQSGALWLLGSRVARSMGVGSGLLAQAAILGTAALVPFRLYVIPEAFILACALVLLALVAPRLADPGGEARWPHALALGAVMAVGITGKVTFAPFVLVPLALYRRRTLVQAYAWFVALSFLILLLARDRWLDMAKWFGSVAKTSARYPGEEITRSAAEGIATMPGAIAQHYPLVLVGAAILVIGLVVRLRATPREPRGPLVRPVVAIALALLGTLAMTYKAYRINDLGLLAPIAGAMAAVGWFWWTRGRYRRWVRVAPAVIAVLAVLSTAWTTVDFVRTSREETDGTRVLAYLDQKAAAGATIATGYGLFNVPTSLYFGNDWSGNVAMRETYERYPQWIQYNIWNGYLYAHSPADGSWTLATCQELQALAASPGGLLVAPGRPLTPQADQLQAVEIRTVPEAVFGSQVVYRVQSVTCPA